MRFFLPILRVWLLSGPFEYDIERNRCSFFPGKIIDEIYRLLRIVEEDQPTPMPAYELLQVHIYCLWAPSVVITPRKLHRGQYLGNNTVVILVVSSLPPKSRAVF
jgi:hypothetical protein